MKTDDLENELRELKLMHLTELELVAYGHYELDQISRDRAEAHLKQCFICERQLELLREEDAALSNRVITAEDEAFVERLMGRTGLRERLAEYLRQMVASWQLAFEPVRRSPQVEELWRYKSQDGHLEVRAVIEGSELIARFSSNEMELEGTRLRLRLGQLSRELTLRRVSESAVAAQVAIPWPYRKGGMADISVEIL